MAIQALNVLFGFAEEIAASNGLTYGMMGWASAMTIAVAIIVAAVVVKRRGAAPPTDIETTIASPQQVSPTIPDIALSQDDSIAQIHNQPISNAQS